MEKNKEVDFLTLLKRSRDFNRLFVLEFGNDPEEIELNRVALLFSYLLQTSGHVSLGEILKNIGVMHEVILAAKVTGELDKMMDDLKGIDESGEGH